MATFTLHGDINELTGEDASRVTLVRIQVSHQITSLGVAYPIEQRVALVNGEFTVDLPADATPDGYLFYVIADQINTSWTVEPAAEDDTVELGYYIPAGPPDPDYVVILSSSVTLTDNNDGTGTITYP